MPCTQPDLAAVTFVPIQSIDWTVDLTEPNNRWLVVSNSPERLNDDATEPVKLYVCAIPIPPGGVLKFRVFLWHVIENPLLHGGYVHLALRMGADPGATFSEHQGIVPQAGGLADRGKCIAKAQLFETWDALSPSSGTVGADEDFVVASHKLAEGWPVTAIHEFEVEGEEGQYLWLKTVYSSDSSTGDWDTSKNFADFDSHIRGSWPHTNLLVASATPAFDANPTFPYAARVSFFVCKQGGLDQSIFARRGPLDPHGEDIYGSPDGNDGLFGVDAEYRCYATNSHDQSAKVWAWLAARNTGHYYFGAVEGPLETASNERTKGGVPVIVWHYNFPGRPYANNAVEINDLSLPNGAIAEIASEDIIPISIRLTNAGSATMPCCLQYGAMAVFPEGPA